MPHVSKYKLDEDVEKDLINTLELVLTRLTKEDEIKGFLLALMTPTERLMLAKRLAMIILLREGLPQSHVATTLHVTRGTIAKMQLFLEARGEGYEFALQNLGDEKALKDFRGMLLKLAKYAIDAAGGRIKPTII